MYTSKKLFSSMLEGKKLLLAEVVLDIPCFELPAFQIHSLFAVVQFAPRNAFCFTSFIFPKLYFKLSNVLMEGQTYLRSWFVATDLMARN